MFNAKSLLIICALFMFIAGTIGCGSNEAVTKVEKLSGEACACKDKDCATKKFEEFKKLYKDLKDVKVTQEQSDKIQESTKKMAECLMKNGIPAQDIMAVVQ